MGLLPLTTTKRRPLRYVSVVSDLFKWFIFAIKCETGPTEPINFSAEEQVVLLIVVSQSKINIT
jgi:hypothetical protein